MSGSVSWLQLELFALGELPPAEATRVRAALAADATLRARLAEIEAPITLRALPDVAPPRRLSPWWAPALVAALGAALWIARPTSVERTPRGVKGAAASMHVVALRGDQLIDDVARFAPDDRLKVRLTCAEQAPIRADVVVFQDGVDFAFTAPITTRCGNAITLPGAFRLDAAPAQICVVLHGSPALRQRLREAGAPALPEGTPCRALAPL